MCIKKKSVFTIQRKWLFDSKWFTIGYNRVFNIIYYFTREKVAWKTEPERHRCLLDSVS